MVRRKKIAILFHELDPLAGSPIYLITSLAKIWADRGIDIEILKGVPDRTDADLIIPHIDLTEYPPAYKLFFKQHANVLNKNIVNTAHSSFSRIRVLPGDPWEGPVIVKTDAQYGGFADRRYLDPASIRLTLMVRLKRIFYRRIMKRPLPINFATTQTIFPRHYPVFDSLDAVPLAAFENPALIVERYIPEQDGELNGVRSSLFLGNRSVDELKKSAEPIIKTEWTDIVDRVPANQFVTSFRNEIGFDYGKIDYVVHDGETTIFDLNRTPVVPEKAQNEQELGLADAIDIWL